MNINPTPVTPLARRRVIQPFETISPTDWQDKPIPSRRWLVEQCFLRGTVALLSGDGGLGKSLLMQQLATAAAIGARWLDLETQPSRTLYLCCEDDQEELHIRQESINRHYGCSFADLEDVLLVPRVGKDNLLMEFNKNENRGRRTMMFDQLLSTIREFGSSINIIDTAADTFGGNEIVRAQVSAFITELRTIAVETDGVVILLAHPSNAGMATGSGLSGSTGWNNKVRSRLYLTKPKRRTEDGADDESEDDNTRWLKTMKSNSGPHGGRIPLRWENGVFIRTDRQGAGSFIDKLAMENAVLDGAAKLILDGALLAADKNAPNSLANRVRTVASCKAFKWEAIANAQEKLLADGRLVRVSMGPPSKRRVYVRPADIKYPGEVSGSAP